MKFLRPVLIALIGAAALGVVARADTRHDWPSTCVELNDVFEQSRGKHKNIGIYERVHGDRAEQACRNEHRSELAHLGSIALRTWDSADVGATARAAMVGTDGSSAGVVTLTQMSHGVLVEADVSGLTPGGHGFHIHTVGACEPDFGAAGGHFNPGERGHGFDHVEGFHAGDLPNIYAGENGAARADFFTANVTLAAGAYNSLFDSDGSAIIIHAKPDTYGEDAGAGGRVACGVVQRIQADN